MKQSIFSFIKEPENVNVTFRNGFAKTEEAQCAVFPLPSSAAAANKYYLLMQYI